MSTLTEMAHALMLEQQTLLCGCRKDGVVMCDDHTPKIIETECPECGGSGEVDSPLSPPGVEIMTSCDACRGKGTIKVER